MSASIDIRAGDHISATRMPAIRFCYNERRVSAGNIAENDLRCVRDLIDDWRVNILDR